MNKYELAFILRPELEDDALRAEFDRVTTTVTRFGGEIEKVDEWGKRRFAYEINKINEGYYYFVTITGPPSMPAEVENRIRITESVLRYMMIRVGE